MKPRLLATFVAILVASALLHGTITGPTAHTTISGPDGPLTTSALNNAAASLLLQAWGEFQSIPCSTGSTSSPSTTWTGLTPKEQTGNNRAVIYYAANPTVSSTQTASGNSDHCSATHMFLSFAGVKTGADPFDQQNGDSAATGASLASGSITPEEDGELVCSVSVVGASSVTEAPTSGMSSGDVIDNTNFQTADHYGGAIACIIQTTATPISVTWSGSNVARAVVIASFKAAAVVNGRSSIMLLGVGPG